MITLAPASGMDLTLCRRLGPLLERASFSVGHMNVIGYSLLSLCFFLPLAGTSVAGEFPSLTRGQTVYILVYSEVLHGNASADGKPDRWLLSAMLSVRNTDPKSSLTLRSIRYHDGNGELIREYPAGKTLGPLATAEVFVEHKDKSGGSGANFLVAWDAVRPINAPIIETVHTNFFGTRALVFTSSGQPLHIE